MFLEITVLKDFRKFTEKYSKRTETLLKKGFIADLFQQLLWDSSEQLIYRTEVNS